ncbi:MAG: alpha-amylase family glycosyl hydrolase, partial [Microgenomates group bacterium]
TAAFFRGKLQEFYTGAPDGWPMWAFSNHDVVRHVSRWAKHGISQDALARQTGALLLSFEGSICLWQGEELGQTDTQLDFEELTDPQGINFWPEPIGRDNTRTPMVWDGSAHGGFSTVKPWLPVKAPQLARNVAAQVGVKGSVLESYREMLAFRRGQSALIDGRTRFLDLPEPILGFVRGDAVLCLFNLSPNAVTVQLSADASLIGPQQAAQKTGATLVLGPNGFAFLSAEGNITARV